MKDDIEIPDEIPRKRRHLEASLDKAIAVWLSRTDLTPSERRRLEEEKERRKRARAREECVVGVVVAEEGWTPPQFLALGEALKAARPTEVLHARLSPKAHGALAGVCRYLGAAPTLVEGKGRLADRAVIHRADRVIAAPREGTIQTHATPGVWMMIGLARHRRLPVTVVLPSGELQKEGDDD